MDIIHAVLIVIIVIILAFMFVINRDFIGVLKMKLKFPNVDIKELQKVKFQQRGLELFKEDKSALICYAGAEADEMFVIAPAHKKFLNYLKVSLGLKPDVNGFINYDKNTDVCVLSAKYSAQPEYIADDGKSLMEIPSSNTSQTYSARPDTA